MTIQELKAIVNNADIDTQNPIVVQVKKENGAYTRVNVKSFGLFSDAMLLNVEVDNDL